MIISQEENVVVPVKLTDAEQYKSKQAIKWFKDLLQYHEESLQPIVQQTK